MKVRRVELYQRRFMNSHAFVLAVRKRLCMPRHFFITFTHKLAVTGYARASRPRSKEGT